MKQPVFKLRRVYRLYSHAANYDDLVHDPAQADDAPNNCGGAGSLPRSAYDGCQQQYDTEMNDGWRSKRGSSLRLTWPAWQVGDEGQDDKLQTDQSAGR